MWQWNKLDWFGGTLSRRPTDPGACSINDYSERALGGNSSSATFSLGLACKFSKSLGVLVKRERAPDDVEFFCFSLSEAGDKLGRSWSNFLPPRQQQVISAGSKSSWLVVTSERVFQEFRPPYGRGSSCDTNPSVPTLSSEASSGERKAQ